MHTPQSPPHPALPPGFVDILAGLVGAEWVRSKPRDLLTYAYDATGEKHLPDVVVFPGSTAEVAAVLQLAHQHRVPVVGRGGATNISGGTVPARGGIVLAMNRLNRIVEIDPGSRLVVVEPCVTNLAVQEALAPHGLFFPPDPASQKASTIGGNCQENSGGPHCLKYGVMTNHVRGVEFVLSDGEIVWLGGCAEEAPGLDLLGVVVGAEGTMGIVTKVVLHVLPLPEAHRTVLAIYDRIEDAVQTVPAILSERILPAAMELMDRTIIQVVEDSTGAGYPRDAEAVLIVEVDGPPEGLAKQAIKIDAICRAEGARDVRVAHDEAERARLWWGRRSAYAAIARKSKYAWVMDLTVPPTRLPEMMRLVQETADRHGVEVFTVAHIGDGNLHPVIPFEPSDPASRARMRAADREILARAIELGGSVTGEHGVGLDKLDQTAMMFAPPVLDLMRGVRTLFDPAGIMNPGKLLPARQGGF